MGIPQSRIMIMFYLLYILPLTLGQNHCCPLKEVVDGPPKGRYYLKEERPGSPDCTDNCIYTRDGEDYCFSSDPTYAVECVDEVLDNGTHKQMYEDGSGLMVPQYMTFKSFNHKRNAKAVKFDVPAHVNFQDLTVIMHTDNDGYWHGTNLKNNMLMKLGSICHVLDLPFDIFPMEMAVNFIRHEQKDEPVKIADQTIKYTSLRKTDEHLDITKLHPDIQNICRSLKIVKSKRVFRKVPLDTEFQLDISNTGAIRSSCCSLETATTYDEGCIKWPNPAGDPIQVHEIVSAGVDLTCCMDNTATNPGCSPAFPGCCQCHCRCTDIADKHDFSECLARPEIPLRKRLTQTLLDTLSDGERNNLVSALVDMKTDIGQHGFNHVSTYHGLPFPGPCGWSVCCPHPPPSFLHDDFVAWHRLYMVNFDTGLRRHKHAARLPYWDWTTPMSDLPDLVKSNMITNPVDPGAADISNPFYHTPRNVQPSLLEATNPPGPGMSLLQRVLDSLHLSNDFDQFVSDFNGIHGDIHVRILGSMGSVDYAATDPIFYLHHSMCDLIWAVFQYLHSDDPSSTANLAPFHDTSNNPNKITLENPNIDGTLDYENDLCYTYNLDIGSSDIVFGGLTLHEIDNEVMLLKQQDRYYAGFFLRNYHTSAVIKFNMCYPQIMTWLPGKETGRKADLEKPTLEKPILEKPTLEKPTLEKPDYRCVPGGELSIFGGPHQIPYINDVVTKISVTHLMKKYKIINNLVLMSGSFNDIKFEVTEIITANGKQQISKDMVFTPVNVFREKNTGIDSMGIHFGDGSNNPPQIRVVAGTHITFITKSKYTIYRANNKEAYGQCDIHQATAIPDLDGFLPGLGYNFYFAINKKIGKCQSDSKLTIYVYSANNMAGKNLEAV